MRKIISLAFDHYKNGDDLLAITYAVCSDGIILGWDSREEKWRMSDYYNKPIPQDLPFPLIQPKD